MGMGTLCIRYVRDTFPLDHSVSQSILITTGSASSNNLDERDGLRAEIHPVFLWSDVIHSYLIHLYISRTPALLIC